MKLTRAQLWKDLVDHPEWSANDVKKTEALIKKLTNQIAKRSLDDNAVRDLLHEVKVYSRNYRRIADKMKKQKKKISKRSIKYIVQKTKKNEKGNKKESTGCKAQFTGGAQISIFGK